MRFGERERQKGSLRSADVMPSQQVSIEMPAHAGLFEPPDGPRERWSRTQWRRKQSSANQSRPRDFPGIRENYREFSRFEARAQLHRADRPMDWAHLVGFPAKNNTVFFRRIRVRKIEIRDPERASSRHPLPASRAHEHRGPVR